MCGLNLRLAVGNESFVMIESNLWNQIMAVCQFMRPVVSSRNGAATSVVL
jgi:hypothetical protein